MRTRVIVLAGVVLVCALLIACGGTTTASSPSPEPTGALTEAEQHYVSDVRADAEVVAESNNLLDDIVDELPDLSASLTSDVDIMQEQLGTLYGEWESRPLPSQRLSHVRYLWLQLLGHAQDAIDHLSSSSTSAISKASAAIKMQGRSTDKLAEELTRLETL